MPLPKELTTVTPLSKNLALLLFIFLPILSFLLGMRYQEKINPPSTIHQDNGIHQEIILFPSPTRTINNKPLTIVNDSSGKWKIFENQQYHYSIHFPSQWFIKSVNSEDSERIVSIHNNNFIDEFNLYNPKIKIFIQDNQYPGDAFDRVQMDYLYGGDAGITFKGDMVSEGLLKTKKFVKIDTTEYDLGKIVKQHYIIAVELNDKQTLVIDSELNSKNIANEMLNTLVIE